jgi:hypothetical protein
MDQAERHCGSGERYLATAGLIVLQDAVELIFLAMLMELGVDERKSLESLTFDQMIGELRAADVPVPKSGTLKAMNKLRVTAKHYGQLMEPATVQGHLNAATQAVDSVLEKVVGRPLREIYLTEAVPAGETRELLQNAASALQRGAFLDALAFTRMAIFLEFELEYCIYEFREDETDNFWRMFKITLGGSKAPLACKTREWILLNVRTPLEYVQIDESAFRLDAIEAGINPTVLQNLRRLTPRAVRLAPEAGWHIGYDAAYPASNVTQENAAYCLDMAIQSIKLKRQHQAATRYAKSDQASEYPAPYVGQPLYTRAERSAEVVRHLEPEDKYTLVEVVHGFDIALVFYRISCTDKDGKLYLGFVEKLQQPLQTEEGDLKP